MNPYWFAPGIVLAVPLAVGPLGAFLGWLRPDTGFILFGFGILVAFVCALALPGMAAYATATGRPWRASALRASLLPMAVAGSVLVYLGSTGYPTINGISTDLAERPALEAETVGPEDAARLEFFAAVQSEAYPDLHPLKLEVSPAAAFERALTAARGMPGWELRGHDAAQGRISAIATTRIFRFVDDVVIRITPAPGGARVDVRSRSRIGGGDLGANARRIRAYLQRVRAG